MSSLRLFASGVGIIAFILSLGIVSFHSAITDKGSFSIVERLGSFMTETWTPTEYPVNGDYQFIDTQSSYRVTLNINASHNFLDGIIHFDPRNNARTPIEFHYVRKNERYIADYATTTVKPESGFSVQEPVSRAELMAYLPDEICFAQVPPTAMLQLSYLLSVDYDNNIIRSDKSKFTVFACSSSGSGRSMIFKKI